MAHPAEVHAENTDSHGDLDPSRRISGSRTVPCMSSQDVPEVDGL